MGPIVYALCQQSVIGAGMFITGLCAFPPLIAETALPLATAAAPVVAAFTVPVDKSYEFELKFTPQTRQELALIGDIAGTRYDRDYCEGKVDYDDIPPARRAGLGRAIPVRVLVRRQPEGTVVADRTFISLCRFAAGGADMAVLRKIGRIDLVCGAYSAQVSATVAVPELAGIRTSFLLVPGHGK